MVMVPWLPGPEGNLRKEPKCGLTDLGQRFAGPPALPLSEVGTYLNASFVKGWSVRSGTLALLTLVALALARLTVAALVPALLALPSSRGGGRMIKDILHDADERRRQIEGIAFGTATSPPPC